MKLPTIFIVGLLLAGCTTQVAQRPAEQKLVEVTKLDPKVRAVTEAMLADQERVAKEDIICAIPPPAKKRWWQFWKKEPIQPPVPTRGNGA